MSCSSICTHGCIPIPCTLWGSWWGRFNSLTCSSWANNSLHKAGCCHPHFLLRFGKGMGCKDVQVDLWSFGCCSPAPADTLSCTELRLHLHPAAGIQLIHSLPSSKRGTFSWESWGAGCPHPRAKQNLCFQTVFPSIEGVGGFVACETLITLAQCLVQSHLWC